MNLKSASHLYGHTIIKHDFPAEYEELLNVLESMRPILRPSGPFTALGRPPTPKRQARKIGGQRRQFLLPIDQAAMNRQLDGSFRDLGWESQPLAAGVPAGTTADRLLRGDFHKNRIFVEVEFGNTASMFRDLFKFQIAGRARVGDVGVLIVSSTQMAKFFDSGVATFEQAVGLLPYMSIGIQLPIWIIGLDPDGWTTVRERYEEMAAVAQANEVICHGWEEAFGSPVEDAVTNG